MILATTIQSEKGKEIIKTANEYIFQEFTVKKQSIGQIELYFFNDTMNGKLKGEDEWLLKYRKDDNEDWDIIAQGNI
jgi:hypothetical protein